MLCKMTILFVMQICSPFAMYLLVQIGMLMSALTPAHVYYCAHDHVASSMISPVLRLPYCIICTCGAGIMFPKVADAHLKHITPVHVSIQGGGVCLISAQRWCVPNAIVGVDLPECSGLHSGCQMSDWTVRLVNWRWPG